MKIHSSLGLFALFAFFAFSIFVLSLSLSLSLSPTLEYIYPVLSAKIFRNFKQREQTYWDYLLSSRNWLGLLTRSRDFKVYRIWKTVSQKLWYSSNFSHCVRDSVYHGIWINRCSSFRLFVISLDVGCERWVRFFVDFRYIVAFCFLIFFLFHQVLFISFRLTSSNGAIHSPLRVSCTQRSDPLDSRKEETRVPRRRQGTPFCSTSRSTDARVARIPFTKKKKNKQPPSALKKRNKMNLYERLVTSDRPAAPSCIANIWKYDLMSDDLPAFLRFVVPAKTTWWLESREFLNLKKLKIH